MKQFLTIFIVVVTLLGSIMTYECPSYCPSSYVPVCAQAEAGGQADTFGNRCALDVEQCLTQQQYVILHEGECFQDPLLE